MGKFLLLSMVVIVLFAAAIISILAIYNAVQETIALRKMRKLNELTDIMEEKLDNV